MPSYLSGDHLPGGGGGCDGPGVAARRRDLRPHHSGCEIRYADVTHAEAAVCILKEATQWLIDRGLSHWALDDFQIANFVAAAAAGELIIGFEGAEAAAVMLLQGADAIYWPTEMPGSALYIHKLAVRRTSAGRRWSAHMVEWAAAQASARAVPRLRLDTLAGTTLQTLCESYGFLPVDRCPIRVATATVIRMERRL
jgi:hypothetical protein